MTEDEENFNRGPSISERIIAALLCRGDLKEEEEEAKPCSMKDLFRFASTADRWKVTIGLLMAAFTGSLLPFTTILSGLIANEMLMDQNTAGNDALLASVRPIIILYAVMAILQFVGCILQQYLISTSTRNIVARFRREFLSAAIAQDAEWLDGHSSGELYNQLNENIDRIRDGIGEKLGFLVRGLFLFFSSTIASFYFNWKTTLILCFAGPSSAILMGMMARFTSKDMRQQIELNGKAATVVEEAIMNVKTIASCNGQEDIVDKFSRVLNEARVPSLRVYFTNGFFEAFFFLLLYIFTTFGLWWGIEDVHSPSPSFDPGDTIIAVNCILQGAYMLGLLGPHMMSLLKARIGAAVIYKTIDRKTTMASSSHTEDLRLRGKIEFKNVHFKYPTRDALVLQGISWMAEVGESIAFAGYSGCGKSTTISLITRLYSVANGSIEIDGRPIEEIDARSLRMNLGLVQQEPYLFNGTIKENIRLGRSWTGNGSLDDRLRAVLKIAHADEFVSKLEFGLDSVIGEGGVKLSGGQKQRIAIARALFNDPPILILDEATSALDVQSEKVVQEALRDASVGRTTITIAHRLSTLKDSDAIYVMEMGKIVQSGSHEKLLNEDGIYAKMAKAQSFETRRVAVDDDFLPTKTAIVRSPSHRSSGRLSRMSMHGGSEEEKKSLQYDGKKVSSIFRMYYSHGNLGKKILLLIFSICRGWEVSLYVVMFKFIYAAINAPVSDYMDPMILVLSFCMFIGVFIGIVLSLAHIFAGWSAECVVSQVKERILQRVLNQEAEFFDRPRTSNAAIVSDLVQHAPNLMAALDNRMVLFVFGNSAYITCALIGIVLDWKLGLFGFGCSLIFLIAIFVLFLLETNQTEKQLDEDHTPELALEMLEHSRTIQLMAVEEYFQKRYSIAQRTSGKRARVVSFLQSLIFSFTQTSMYVLGGLSFLVGLGRLYDGSMDGEALFTIAMAVEFTGWAIAFYYPAIPEILRANIAAKTLYRYYDLPDVQPSDQSLRPTISGSFTVDRVTFAYPSRPQFKVANSLSLHAFEGQSVAFVGPSGCGKSTLISLLERFYDQQLGTINMDGHDHRLIDKRHLRQQIGLVGQEPVLFQGTILENVRLGCPDATLEDVVEACRLANATSFVEALPLSYDTDVGERGRGLSGGQKQRIAIARALIRKPKLLLLDEATSALDAESEKIVQMALNQASEGRTVVSIAHRLSSIQDSSCIYFIDDGQVSESGSHQDLLQNNGRYSAYVLAQSLEH